MERRRSLIFTDKKHTKKGIMSTSLGVISLCSVGLAIYMSYEAKGTAGLNMGVVGFMILVFSIAGIILGYLGKMEQDCFRFFAYLGFILNLLTLFCVSIILYAGAYGL